MADVQLVFDHWFSASSGGFTCDANYPPSRLRSRYLRSFDRLQVVGRCRGVRSGAILYALDESVGSLDNDISLEVMTVAGGPKGAVSALARLAMTIVRGRRRGDTLILVMPGMLSVLASWVARLVRRPYAVELVGDVGEALAAIDAPGLVVRASARAVRNAVAHANGVAYVTEAALQEKFPPHRAAITASYSSIELPDASLAEAVRAIPHSRVVTFCTVASMSQPYKGISTLLDSAALVRENGHSFRLRIVGGGRLLPEYEQLAATLELTESVDFVGGVPGPAAVRAILDECDVYVHPSWTEGLPRALIEAMAAGLPCVATRVGGVPDLIEEPWLCPPRDVHALATLMSRMIGDRAAAVEQARRNLARAKDFVQSEVWPKRDDYYRRITTNSR